MLLVNLEVWIVPLKSALRNKRSLLRKCFWNDNIKTSFNDSHLMLNRYRNMVSTHKKWKWYIWYLFSTTAVQTWSCATEQIQFIVTLASRPLYYHLIFVRVITIKYNTTYNVFQPNMFQSLKSFSGGSTERKTLKFILHISYKLLTNALSKPYFIIQENQIHCVLEIKLICNNCKITRSILKQSVLN